MWAYLILYSVYYLCCFGSWKWFSLTLFHSNLRRCCSVSYISFTTGCHHRFLCRRVVGNLFHLKAFVKRKRYTRGYCNSSSKSTDCVVHQVLSSRIRGEMDKLDNVKSETVVSTERDRLSFYLKTEKELNNKFFKCKCVLCWVELNSSPPFPCITCFQPHEDVWGRNVFFKKWLFCTLAMFQALK